ncbi:hypothetical protein GCM10010964_30220 [Caldovatus sediminis]|uniref:site-specific DNA-methyltransferase (adenine-specific) n=2 Tax=Caldovatus sediminis TaxID=2041189 RepID=A0A8J3EEH3_9PROT|nr:hypothetical protein GCM10010964_30220 [Caldovatus sediminis]
MVHEPLIAYAREVRLDRRANRGGAGDGTGLELLLAPRFKALIEAVLASRMPAAPRVLPEYERQGIGRPDIAFARPGAPARAFIELKEPGKPLDPRRLRGHDADQFRRFRELPLWGLCNFHTLHLYRRDALLDEAVILPAAALDPATADAAAERLIRRTDPAAFLRVLDALALAGPVAPRSAAEVAEALAQAARLVRAVVADQCRAGAPADLAAVRDEFRETLFAHAAAGGYDESDETALFANAFAQTLAFGLLLAREASRADLDRDAYRRLPEGAYPLLRATLRALTQDEILDLLGAAFDVVLDTVNAVDTDLLRPRAGHDPILYFYEDFLSVFDPEAKKRHGVFFTPVPVVRFMVAATDRALREALGTRGLLDPAVLLLDPACGTGTFLVAAAARGMEAARAEYGEGAVPAEMAALAARLHGFELLVGPYTVAHYRMLREVAANGVAPARRLPIFLADTLAPPSGARGVTPRLGLLARPIVAERQAADELKRSTPIIAILGNPPYRRLAEGEERALVAGWDNGFWEDLKAPVRAAGWGGELNTFPDLYVAFWRWCLWKLFESDGAPGRGVLCLITNRTFLAGHPYAGLRRMLRRRFDRIEIVDLRGDSRGARPAGVEEDECVFAIQAGVCVVTAVATGAPRAPGAEARVRYADVWRHGAFTARDKLALLERARGQAGTLHFVAIARGGLADFVPAGFEGLDWPALPEVFGFRSSGVQTKRDAVVYAFADATLHQRMTEIATAPEDEAKRLFHETRDRTVGPARGVGWAPSAVRDAAYRPLDRRRLHDRREFIDFPRPALAEAWGASNVCLYALPAGTGAGPAVWIHGLLPDYHAFRGSYGGYAFPLWDRRRGATAHNLNPALLAGLAAAYGAPVTPEAAFDAITALLSATSYTRRFAWDLEEAFAHIPFPAEADAFAEAARLGAAIREVETFARAPGTAFRSARLLGRASGVTLAVPPIARAFLDAGDGTGFVPLQEDQSLRLARLPERVWAFAVSGYRVLPRWLAARQGEALDAALQRAILDVAWRIEELLHLFDAADAVLARALERPLTRAALGLSPPGTPPAAGVEEEGDDERDSTA